jgi:mannosyltransferase OCH1-like enzyme
MAIPKTIYQTYRSSRLPLLTQWHVRNMRRTNPEYDYQFYDDDRVDEFIRNEYGGDILALYRRINIGAAKADLFRYAVLFKRGGIYLDIDSLLVDRLDSFLAPDDRAVISLESNREHYAQWALIYEPAHPFLGRTLEKVLGNLRVNRFPYNVHGMTGPGAYTLAIKECLSEVPVVAHRELGVDYRQHLKFTYPMSKFFLYGFSQKNHWQKQGRSIPVIT